MNLYVGDGFMNPEVYGKYEIFDAHSHIFPEKIADTATDSIGQFYGLPMNNRGKRNTSTQTAI